MKTCSNSLFFCKSTQEPK